MKSWQQLLADECTDEELAALDRAIERGFRVKQEERTMTTFFDAFASGLVPVRVVRGEVDQFDDRMVVVEVTRDTRSWKKGEEVLLHPRSIVVKARKRGIHQLVKTADLSGLDIEWRTVRRVVER